MPSAKVLSEKQAIVKELSGRLGSACAGVLVDYKGTDVATDTEMRRKMREAGVDYSVIKNTMLRFAAEEAGLDGLTPFLSGPSALALSTEDPVAPAKVLYEYVGKAESTMTVKVGFVDGKLISATEVEALSKLPAKDVLVQQVLGTMMAPVSGLANVLNANIRGLAVALQAIADQKSA